MSDERMFPIMANYYRKQDVVAHPPKIPWSIAELAYSVYVNKYGRCQTLERLAERGGFSADEMDDFLPDWRDRCSALAARDAELAALRKQVEALKASREMWRRAAYNDYVKNGTMDQPRLADAACRAAGVEVED